MNHWWRLGRENTKSHLREGTPGDWTNFDGDSKRLFKSRYGEALAVAGYERDDSCFAGTRVAVQTFFDHLAAEYTIEEFLEQFPTVRREQVDQLLELLQEDAERVAVAQ